MPIHLYEVVAQGARYWFVFLMILIVWRSYRWYQLERKQRKQSQSPQEGYVGTFTLIQAQAPLEQGEVISVPFEGTLGSLRSHDIILPVAGVAHAHLHFTYEENVGLVLIPYARNYFQVNEQETQKKPLTMYQGDRLYVGTVALQLQFFAGYEVYPPSTVYAGKIEIVFDEVVVFDAIDPKQEKVS